MRFLVYRNNATGYYAIYKQYKMGMPLAGNVEVEEIVRDGLLKKHAIKLCEELNKDGERTLIG